MSSPRETKTKPLAGDLNLLMERNPILCFILGQNFLELVAELDSGHSLGSNCGSSMSLLPTLVELLHLSVP